MSVGDISLTMGYRDDREDSSTDIKSRLGDSHGDTEEDDDEAVITSKPRLIRRRSTFIIQDIEDHLPRIPRQDFENDLLSATQHTGGIRAILERANNRFVFPDEIKSYISAHFKMIKDENEHLLQSLESKTEQLDTLAKEHQECKRDRRELKDLRQRVKKLETQLDREKAKTKAMIRQIKDDIPDKDDGIIWFGANKAKNEAGENINNVSGEKTKSASTTSASDKKRIKQMKSQIQNLQTEVKKLNSVLVREVGSTSRAQAAIASTESLGNPGWEGRAEQILRLEEQLAEMTKNLDSAKRGSSGRSSSKVAEAERDRLSEYVRVLSDRLAQSESIASKAESLLREERRKTARLEHLLEKTKISGSGSSQQLLASGTSSKDRIVHDLEEELEAAREELSMCRQTRKEDRDMYLKMLAETKQLIMSETALN